MHLGELLFFDKHKFKRLNMASMDKKKQVASMLYSITPSDVNLQTSLMPKVMLAKILSQKIYSLGPFLS